METQKPVPINPPPQQLPQSEVSNANANPTGEDHSNNGAGNETAQPSPPTAGTPAVEPAHQESSSVASAGITAASSATAENHAGVTDGGDGGVATPASAAGGMKKEGGGSQPQPRSAKRSREASVPVGLPKNMVRRIMKIGEDTRNISNEALVIVVKASELFLERFAAQAFDHAEKLGRKTIKYRDVSDIRVKDPNLLFLEAVVPP